MKIAAALAAELAFLTAALDEPDADVANSLRRLAAGAAAAMPTFLGLSVSVVGSDPPFAFTAFVEGIGTGDVGTSLRLALPGVDGARPPSPVVVDLYARSPGTFVDLTADLAWLTGRPLSDFVLDQHLSEPVASGSAISLFEASVINQAIGVLIGQGYTPEQAERHLTAESAGTGTGRHAVGLCVLAGLNGR
ncbi:MAG: hypothetical protein WBZ37_16315 [Mycobacterium sp.]